MNDTNKTNQRAADNRLAKVPVANRLMCLSGFSLLFLSSVACSSLGLGNEDTLVVTDEGVREEFAPADLESWTERSFLGNTSYEAVDLDGRTVLKAETDGKASLLFRSVNPVSYTHLTLPTKA